MIVDASVIIDALIDSGPRGVAARNALAANPASERLIAPGHFAFEVMSGLRAAAGWPNNPSRQVDIEPALADAEALGIDIEATPWVDIRRGWELSSALRYADGIYVAAAERLGLALLTSDARIARSGASIRCEVVTVTPQ